MPSQSLVDLCQCLCHDHLELMSGMSKMDGMMVVTGPEFELDGSMGLYILLRC